MVRTERGERDGPVCTQEEQEGIEVVHAEAPQAARIPLGMSVRGLVRMPIDLRMSIRGRVAVLSEVSVFGSSLRIGEPID